MENVNTAVAPLVSNLPPETLPSLVTIAGYLLKFMFLLTLCRLGERICSQHLRALVSRAVTRALAEAPPNQTLQNLSASHFAFRKELEQYSTELAGAMRQVAASRPDTTVCCYHTVGGKKLHWSPGCRFLCRSASVEELNVPSDVLAFMSEAGVMCSECVNSSS